MTLDQFISKYNGKYVDVDGAYGAQCKDLFSRYNKDVVGNPNYIFGNAHQLFDAAPTSVYEKIKNTPSGIPRKGDIIIWNEGIGKYGHVGIFIEGNVNRFTSFDQNFPIGSPCHIQAHSYKAVTGWLRAKTAPTPPPPPPPDPCAGVKNELAVAREDLRSANGTIKNLEDQLKALVENPKVIKETVVKEVPIETIKTIEVEKVIEVEPVWLRNLRQFFSNIGRK